MTNNKVYYNHGWWDEQYTPWYWVEILLPYIEHLKWKTIWCPFDKEDSQFVKVLINAWHDVVYSHIEYWQDYFEYEPKHWDVMISNPPYKNKRAYWERALSFNKPFALLLPVNILSDSMINKTMVYHDKQLQLLIPQRRMRFYNNVSWETLNKITFKACYFGYNIFKQDIILTDMELN